MKKALLIVAMGAMLSMSASAQWFDLSNNKDRFEVGFNLGQVGIGTQFSKLGYGGSISFYGVYVDFLTAGPMYKYSNQIDVGPTAQVPDSTTTTINLGYQVPVLPWLRIMPLIGYCWSTSGYTDFSTINAETTGSGENTSVRLYHDYNETAEPQSYFNFGGGLVITPVKWFSIYGVYTTHAIYGGISVNISAFAE